MMFTLRVNSHEPWLAAPFPSELAGPGNPFVNPLPDGQLSHPMERLQEEPPKGLGLNALRIKSNFEKPGGAKFPKVRGYLISS